MLQEKSSYLSIKAPDNCRLLILDQWKDFLPLLDVWQSFLSKLNESGNPFLEPEWLQRAWEYQGKPMRLSLLFSGETIVTAMAFCPRWNTGYSVLVPVRSIHSMPHLPMIFPAKSLLLTLPDAPPVLIEWSIAQTLMRIPWDVGIIGFLNEQTEWFEKALDQVLQQQGWISRDVPCSDEAVIVFPANFESYWSTRSSSMRQKIKKGELILRQYGDIQIKELHEEHHTWQQCWNAIQTIYDNGWQKNAGLSPFDLPWRKINMHHLESFYQKKRIRIYMMFISGIPAAYELRLSGGNDLYCLARGMDQKYRKGAAGNVLMKWGLEHACREGFAREYLGPVSDQPHYEYKKHWLNRIILYHKIQFLRPRSWYGILDWTVNQISPINRVWKQCNLTALSHAIFYKLQSLRNRLWQIHIM